MRTSFFRDLDRSRTRVPTHLIRAACAEDPEQALRHWDLWRNSVHGLEHVEPGCARLFPRIHSVIRTCRPGDPDLSFLEETYRLTWFSNQRLLGALAQFLDLTHPIGIPVMLFKGAAVLGTCYPDEGTCFMADVDVAVARGSLNQLADTLDQAGWRRRPLETPRGSPIHQSEPFAAPGGEPVEIHWDLLRWPTRTVAEETLWETAETIGIRGRPCRTPSNEDLLLQILVRGFTAEKIRQWRWMVDSSLLIRKRPLKWERFHAEAVRRGVAMMCAEALEFLGDTTSLDLDREIIRILRKTAPPPDRAIHIHFTGEYRHLGIRSFFCLLRLKWQAAIHEGKIDPGIRGWARFFIMWSAIKLNRAFSWKLKTPPGPSERSYRPSIRP